MKHPIARSDLPVPKGPLCLACLLLLFVLPLTSNAQVELRADKQIFLEAIHGTETIKKGPNDKLYVLTRSVKPPSSLWISDYSGSSMRQILGGGSEPTDLRFPKDFTVDRNGNVIVVDGSIKIFSGDGKLLSFFPSARPESVGVLSDGGILVSGFPRDNLMSVFDRQGKLLRGIGIPAKIDEDSFSNAVLNMGTIVVDSEDNIYYVFRYIFTPVIRRFKSDGTLTAEWCLGAGEVPAQIVAAAKVKYQENKKSRSYGGVRVLTAAAFDEDSKTLWVASGARVFQLDSSGKTIRTFELARPEGGPIQASGLLVDGDFIRATGPLHGTFEFFKPH
jgi:hypothetical protein